LLNDDILASMIPFPTVFYFRFRLEIVFVNKLKIAKSFNILIKLFIYVKVYKLLIKKFHTVQYTNITTPLIYSNSFLLLFYRNQKRLVNKRERVVL